MNAIDVAIMAAFAVYLVGSSVAGTLAWQEERDFAAEHPQLAGGRKLAVYAAAGMFSWFAVWAICRHRADRRNIEAQVKAIRDAMGGGK